jgi:hypothetical protein
MDGDAIDGIRNPVVVLSGKLLWPRPRSSVIYTIVRKEPHRTARCVVVEEVVLL